MRPSTAVAPAPVLSSGPASFAVHLGFAVHGVVTTLLPPILPALGVAWALDDAQLGRLFTAQFVGSMAGALARKMAAITLTIWKKGVDFDPTRLQRQAA